MIAAWAPVIAAGVEAAAGLLSQGSPADARRGQRHENEIATRRHAKNVRIGAERAGFNPLTYLMANGAPAQVGMAQSSAPLASFEALGNMAGGLFTALSTDAKAEATQEAAKRQFERVSNDQARARNIGGVVRQTFRQVPPLAQAAQARTPEIVSVADAGYSQQLPDTLDRTEVFPTSTRPGSDPIPAPRGQTIRTDRMTAEDGELIYGEIGGEVIGLRNAAEDAYDNYVREDWKDFIQEAAGWGWSKLPSFDIEPAKKKTDEEMIAEGWEKNWLGVWARKVPK